MFRSIFIGNFAISISCIVILVLGSGNGYSLKNRNPKLTSSNSKIAGPIQKPPSDSREYLGLTLENGMKVLLVSDLKATKAAAALTIAAGTMNDPKELPGLAHFVEHAVFLGNPKYPEENGFSKYLSAHGGSRNAFTSQDHTNFHFNVAPKSLQGALDRFAQFFVSPYFNESSLEREVMAVNSENEKNIPDDTRRTDRVESSTADPNHPYSYFRTGSRDTLWVKPKEKNIDVRQAIMDFHKTYYSANIMTLAVLGPQPLEELQKMVEEIFLEVPNRNTTMPYWPQNPYGSEQLQKQLEIVPISDIRSISISFPIPYLTDHYDSFPTVYPTYLIGHEGEGSLLSLLKKKNWATSLVAGPSIDCRGFATFKVGVGLTKEGLKNYENVTCHVFEYVQMLRDLGPQEWYFEEIRDMLAINYRFKDESQVTSLATELSTRMLKYPIERAVSVGSLLTKYEPDLITEVMNSLRPDNSRITIVSKDFDSKTKLEEKYYGVKYNFENINSSLIQKWKECSKNEGLFFPPKNEFIPSKFDLKPRDEEQNGIIPRVINDTTLSKIWFLQDNEYSLPKAVVNVELFSPSVYVDPLATCMNYMFAHLVLDSLSEFSYTANLADLTYNVVNTAYGLDIKLNGYDHKLGVLLNKILETIANFEFSPERFETSKDAHIRFWRSKAAEEPLDHANSKFTYLLREKKWSFDELLSVSKDINAERFGAFVQDFLSRLKFQWLFYGNLTPKEALKMAADSQAHFVKRGTQALLPSQIVRLRDIKIPEGTNWLFKEDHKTHSSSSIGVLFQTGIPGTRDNVLLGLLDQLADRPSYDQLRTKEQLGYTVGTVVRKFRGSQGFLIMVQGSRHPAYVESRIDSFLRDLKVTFQNLTKEEFEKQKSSYAVRKSQKPKTMVDRGTLLWSEISLEHYNFDKQRIELAELDSVTLEDFQQFFNDHIGPDSDKRRRLSVHIISVAESGAGKKPEEVKELQEVIPGRVEINDVTEWKKQRELFPCFRSTSSITSTSNLIHDGAEAV